MCLSVTRSGCGRVWTDGDGKGLLVCDFTQVTQSSRGGMALDGGGGGHGLEIQAPP